MTAILAWVLLFALDGGVAASDAGVRSASTDAEVIAELELLEQLDAVRDLDLLQTLELSR